MIHQYFIIYFSKKPIKCFNIGIQYFNDEIIRDYYTNKRLNKSILFDLCLVSLINEIIIE